MGIFGGGPLFSLPQLLFKLELINSWDTYLILEIWNKWIIEILSRRERKSCQLTLQQLKMMNWLVKSVNRYTATPCFLFSDKWGLLQWLLGFWISTAILKEFYSNKNESHLGKRHGPLQRRHITHYTEQMTLNRLQAIEKKLVLGQNLW